MTAAALCRHAQLAHYELGITWVEWEGADHRWLAGCPAAGSHEGQPGALTEREVHPGGAAPLCSSQHP